MNQNAINATLSLEAGILGAIFLRPDTLVELPRLEVDDFFDLRHRAVFAAMRNLEAANTPIDPVTVEAEVAKWAGHHDSVTMDFLGSLALDVPTVENAMEYARQVREAGLSRRVSLALSGVLELGKRTGMDGGELLSSAFAALSGIDQDQPDTAVSVATLAVRRFKQLEQIAGERARGERTMTGFPTGSKALDEKIGGVQAGIVTIVAARPAMGKSSFGLAIADDCSANGFGVHVFSLEDTEDAYADRSLSRTSQVPAEAMRNAELNTKQCGDLAMAMHKLKGRRWIIDGRSGITADEIVRSVRRHRRANGTNVVIVDYVQLVKKSRGLSSHDALTEVITILADAAKADKLAYVVMSQLNREVEKRQDKRPQLSDLRESGSLEERSKCVIGLYRGSVYGLPIKGIDWDHNWHGRDYEPTEDDHAGQVQLCVLKNSNGRTGTVFASWHGATTRLS